MYKFMNRFSVVLYVLGGILLLHTLLTAQWVRIIMACYLVFFGLVLKALANIGTKVDRIEAHLGLGTQPERAEPSNEQS